MFPAAGSESNMNLDKKRLVQIVRRFGKKRVVVLGDLMLDEFLWGSVSRISPEAPVPVVEVKKETVHLGGAGNVTFNLWSLGAAPVPLGVIGKDEAGVRLLAEFRRLGVDLRGVVQDPARTTSVKTRIIAHHQQVCRADRENRDEISTAVRQKLARLFRQLLNSAQSVVLSDYAKGVLCPALVEELLPMARARRVPVCVDPKVKNFALYRQATVITPNKMEAEQASGVAIEDEGSLVEAGRRIREQAQCDHLLVTRGEEGMSLFASDGRVEHIPTPAVEVFDVTGAGDTVISTLALGLATGATIREAAILANFAAGIVVGKLGTAAATPEELISRIRKS